MGELILCDRMLAAMPYFLEEMSIHVYSLEELSYYIEHNTCLLTDSFMNRELTDWIGSELKKEDLAAGLVKICEDGGSLAEFVELLIRQVGYCTQEGCLKIVKNLREIEQRPPYESMKMRADWYVENKRYICGIQEYRKLLQMEEAKQQPVFLGSVWHNMGTSFARLFLFEEALSCYQNAYRCSQDEMAFHACANVQKCMGISEKLPEEKQKILKEVSAQEMYRRVDQIFAAENIQAAKKAARVVLENWKSDYIKKSRL